MRISSVLFGVLALRVASVLGQVTQTLIDDLGQTVVEVVTTDPLGLLTTDTLLTLTTTTTPTTTATTATTTTPDVQQGPVGMPATQPPAAGPTQYVYTTTDALGEIIQVTDTFTPTFASSEGVRPTLTGTILDYSEWLTMVGGTSSAAVRPNAAASQWEVNKFVVGAFAATLSAILGGAWMVL
ncbi:unnamed protein product [Somion occarium]|uniref:Uncharacterized protein n=1 Tax=Somion occarium TaxID=3059160 RepID=A0ABP1E6Z4_9APHY